MREVKYVEAYCRMAWTSIGAMVNEDNQATQLIMKLVIAPWLICGICAVPPARGNSTESSAKVSAMTMVANPPITQAIIAAAPAILAAYKGANNQAEPTIPLILSISRLSGVNRRFNIITHTR